MATSNLFPSINKETSQNPTRRLVKISSSLSLLSREAPFYHSVKQHSLSFSPIEFLSNLEMANTVKLLIKRLLICIVFLTLPAAEVIIIELIPDASEVTFFLIFIVLLLGFISVVYCYRKAYKKIIGGEEKDDSLNLPRLSTRFSFEELKSATENFSYKLGQGGFGSVFQGKLADNTKVAVKRLVDGIGQGRKEFLAEVETIGSLHHINVVRLIGFCAEKSHRLLVFEFMENGSLDKWIFGRSTDTALDWQTKAKIITDIAKGLAYLHEECRQVIAHLDIKPQNILLDENFNAKVADFGLAKLVDRDQSEFNTRMRGTIGYLAPDWLISAITEKVDVFSFGVVVMEIVCGRKNLDHSQPEEGARLISQLQEKVKVDRLLDMVDRNRMDIHLQGDEAVGMMKLAMWCLQTNSRRRPSMSAVVKVLEGNLSMATDLDYNLYTYATLNANEDLQIVISSELSTSILSGPR